MDTHIQTILCLALAPNIYIECTGKGRQREIDDAQLILTAVYDPAWTPKPSDWDWRASFEREWVSDQQTFLQARELTTPPHLRKFKYFSPDYYKRDMAQFNTARFTEQTVKYQTYPTLPPGYSHAYRVFEDIVGPNPYNWSNETMDYANNIEKYEELYKKQQEELNGKRNMTVLKHLYKEWLKIDPLRHEIKDFARSKRNVENDKEINADALKRNVINNEMETEERRMFSEYEQFHINVSKFMYEEKLLSTTEGVVIKEDRPKRQVTNDEMETEERRMFSEYEQFHINVSKFMYEEKLLSTTEGVVIKENRHKRDIRKDRVKRTSSEQKKHSNAKTEIEPEKEIDLSEEYVAFEKELNNYIKQKGSKKARIMLESVEKKKSSHHKTKNHVTTDKTAKLPVPFSPETDIFDDLGPLEDDQQQVFHWNNTILDDLGSNWEGNPAGERIDWKAMRDERARNTKYVDFRNLSWNEINEKYGLPLYATDSPPLNESLTKIVDSDKYFQMYDVLFPGKIRLLDNYTIAPMFTNAPADTELPLEKRKTMPLDQYDDFYNIMFKDHFRKHFTFGTIHYVPRMNVTEPPPLSTKLVNQEEFFKWYDQEFTFGHRNLEQYTVHPMFMDDVGTECPANQTKILDANKFDEEYDLVFGHRKKYVDMTPNKAWCDLEEMGAQTTEPWWTFYDSAYADIQERKRTVVDTNEMIEKAINMPEHDPDSDFEKKEKAFEKELENVEKKMLNEKPHKANHISGEDGLKKQDCEKARVKRHLRRVDMRALDKLEKLANENHGNDQNQHGSIISKGTVCKERPYPTNNVSLNTSNSLAQRHQANQKHVKINFNVQNIFGTVRPQKHKIVRREEKRTSIHLFEYLKWGRAKRKRQYTTTKRYKPIFFDTNDSYIIFKNYMGRVTDGEISDFDYANAVYGEYIDRYLTAQFDMFKRMYTRYSTPFQRPTWTRRTGYTDSFGRKFTFDPNYTYTTPWEEIDVIQFISECRARRRTTTQPTPKDLCPFTGTLPPIKKMTKDLDPKWLVEFGLMTTSNVTTERTTSMYYSNWLKYKQKQKIASTYVPFYLRNIPQRISRTRVKPVETTKTTNLTNVKKVWKALRTKVTQNIRKTTSLFYKNFILNQNKLRKHTSILHKYNYSLKIASSTLTNPTNATTYLAEFFYHTSGRVKNFLSRYGSFAKEHMEKGFLRQRVLSQNPIIDHCFQDQIRNLSSHIDKVDKRIREKGTTSFSESIESNEEKLKKVKESIKRNGPAYAYDSYDISSDDKKINRKKRGIIDDLPSTMKLKTFPSTKYCYYKKRNTENASREGNNNTKTTSIFMRNFMARINLTSPKRRRFKITKRTSLAVRLLNLTTNYFPWDFFGNRTVQHVLMHYYTGSENFTFPPIYSYTEGPQNNTWSIELEEDPFFRLRRRFMGKTKRHLRRTKSIPKSKKKNFEDMFDDWRNAPLRPGLPSEMLSVQSKQLDDHVAFLSTMHYVKTYTEKITVMEKILRDESYSDYEKYQKPKLRTQHSMDFDNVVKYRLYKADKLRRNRIGTLDSDYIIESVQSFMDDNQRKSTFTFPMGNFKTLYPRYNPFYYNRSVINTDLFVDVLRSLTRHPGTMAQFQQEYLRNMTERRQKYLKENPDKKEDEVNYDDFEDTNEAISHMYYMGLTTMLEEDLPHKNFDYIRNDYTAIDHAVFHWSIIGKKQNRINTIPYEPGQSSTTSYLDYYWKTPSTLDWRKYWKYPYSTNATTKPTGPDRLENREYAKNLEQNLDPDARAQILADLEQLGELIDYNTTTARTILWDKGGEEENIYKVPKTSSKRQTERFTTRVTDKTIDIGDIIDPADISRELRRRKRRNLEDITMQEKTSDEKVVCITAKPIEWRIPDSVIDNIRGKTPADDIHNTEIAFKYLQNCTDSEEYLKITLPNYMRDKYYSFTKYTTTTTPIIRWTMPKNVLNMIENGTNPIRLEAEKHVPYKIFRRKIMHMLNMKMKAYSIPFYRQRKDKTPFSLNTDERDEIYYDTEEREGIRHRATHNYRMVTYMFPLFSNSCERMIKDMVEGYHNIYDPPAVKRIFMKNQTSTMKAGDYDGEWVKLNPNDLLRFPEPTVYWPTINRHDATYRPPWIKNSTRTTKQKKTTTPFDTESFDSKDSLVRDDWLFTTQHWNDVNNANITALQIFMDRPPGQSSEFNDYCRKHGLPLDENGNPPPDWYDSNVPSSAENFWNEIKEHNTYAPFSYSDERIGTVENYVKKKDMDKCIQHMMNNETINLAEEDFNETSTLVIKSRAYLSKRFSRERYYRYDAKYLKALKEMNAPKKVKSGYKDAEYKRIEKLYEGNKNNKSNIFLSNIYRDGIKPGHPDLRSEEEEINQPLSWEYNPNYTAVESDTIDPLENPFLDPVTTTTENPYTLVDLSDLLKPSGEESPETSTMADIPLQFIDNMLAKKKKDHGKFSLNQNIFPATTINAYTCEFITDLMSSYELRKKNIPKDAIVAHPYGRPQPYYKKVIYDRLGRYIGTTFVSVEQ